MTWLKQMTKDKKALILSTYILFMFIGFLSLWLSIGEYTGKELSPLFAPIFYGFLLLLGVLLLSTKAAYVLRVALYIMSTLVISTFILQINGWDWSNEIIAAFTIIIPTSLGIFYFSLKSYQENKSMLYKPIIYSFLFFGLLLIFKVIPIEYNSFIITILFGQAVGISLIPVFYINETTEDNKGISYKDSNFLTYNNAKAVIVLYLVMMSGMFYFLTVYTDIAWILLIYSFSFFIISAIFNSFNTSLKIHSTVLVTIIVLLMLVLFLPNVPISTFIMATVLSTGILAQWYIFIESSHYKFTSSLIVIIASSVVSLIPLALGIEQIQREIQVITLFLIVSTLLFVVTSLLLSPLFHVLFVVGKKRSIRPYPIKMSDYFSEKSAQNFEKEIDIDERERNLVLQYKKWLEKKEIGLEQDFSKNDD